MLLCHDYLPVVPTRAETEAIESRLREHAPRIGWLAARLGLGRWSESYAPRPSPPQQLPPLHVAIGDTDNTTPHRGGERVVRQLPVARAIRHGDGHAAFLLGNSCLVGHVQRYFEDGVLPPEGTRCPAELLHRIPDRPGA